MTRRDTTLDRRRFVKVTGATAGGLGPAGCSGTSGSDGPGDDSSTETAPKAASTPNGVQPFEMAIRHVPFISSSAPAMVSFEEAFHSLEEMMLSVDMIDSRPGWNEVVDQPRRTSASRCRSNP